MNATIANRIREELENEYPHLYFRCKNSDDETITIRVADHCMNEKNNYDRGQRTISFISNHIRKSEIWPSDYEWVINENGMTSEYETIEDILKDFDIVKMID